MAVTDEVEGTVSIPVSEYEALKEAVAKLERENKRLSDELTILLNRLFRKKSERLDPNQLRMFLEELVPPKEEGEVEEVQVPAHTKKRRKGHGRSEFPAHLPREITELELPEDRRACPDCGQEMAEFGEDVTERGHIIPARMLVKRYVRKKYACPDGHGVRTPELPPTLIDRGKYEPSAYAHLAVAKYGDHLPLHRLSGIYKRHGFHLPKSTMWEMLAKLDEIVAQPILRQMREELRLSTHLNADETPATVRLEDRKGGLQDLVWVTDLAPFWLGPHAGTLPRSRASQPPHRGPRDPP